MQYIIAYYLHLAQIMFQVLFQFKPRSQYGCQHIILYFLTGRICYLLNQVEIKKKITYRIQHIKLLYCGTRRCRSIVTSTVHTIIIYTYPLKRTDLTVTIKILSQWRQIKRVFLKKNLFFPSPRDSMLLLQYNYNTYYCYCVIVNRTVIDYLQY